MMNGLTTDAAKNGWNKIQFYADVLKRAQTNLLEYDQAEAAHLLRSIANFRLYDGIDNQPFDNDLIDSECALRCIRSFLLLHDHFLDELSDEIILKYYSMIKKFNETQFPPQIHVTSFAYPYFCSISFTNQYRSAIKKQMEEITGINDLNCLTHGGNFTERPCFMFQFRPVGVGAIFEVDNPLFYFSENENGNCNTYIQSSILTHDLRRPCNTFFWVRCFSNIDKSKEIKLWDDFKDGELTFEILENNPRSFPADYSSLPYKFRSSFKHYRSSLYMSYLWNFDQRNFLKEAICNPTLWIDNLIEYKETAEKYNHTGIY